MQITTTMRYYLTPVRIAIIDKLNKQVLMRAYRKGNPCSLFMGMQTGVATVQSSMGLPQKIENGTAL